MLTESLETVWIFFTALHDMTEELAEQFNAVAKQLIKQGEDAGEMLYWMDIFPDIPEDKQRNVLALFKKEAEKLALLG